MRRIFLGLALLILMVSNSWATVGWNKSIPATSENPQAISPDVIENNTALDLMLQNYRDGGVYVKLISTSEIDIGPGGVMLSNSGGSTRLMVANASLTAVSSTNIDTGTISASSTYYLYAYASSTTATTFSVIFSASSTSPTGITYYAPLGSFTTDSSKNFVEATSNVNPQIGYGSWVTKTCSSSGTPYLASTDLNVNAYAGNNDWIKCYTDGNTTPTTLRLAATYLSGVAASCNLPVRKGDYWMVTTSATTPTCYTLSLGS